MPNQNGRHATPTDERNDRPHDYDPALRRGTGHNDDQRFLHDDDRYGRSDRQVNRPSDDDGGFRSREDSWRQSDQYGQGQSGYTAGRYQGDRSLGFQSRNQGYPGSFEDNARGGDDRFAGRGGSAYWQPASDRGGQGYGHQGYGNQGFGGMTHGASNMGAQSGAQGSDPSAWRRHNVGNYGYGSDSRSQQQGSMLDQNQGYGQQGHFGGSYGGFGHVGSYGSEGGAQSHGQQGWQGWEGNPHGPGMTGQGQVGGHRGKGPKNFQRSDERIREAVSEALEIHDHIDATHVEVLVKNGEVTLSGNVDDRDQKRLAEDITASVSGVRDVQNQIRVSSDKRGGANKDATSTARSEHAMPDTTDPKKARA